MAVAGIIAEYNPFHRGHAWQIAEAKRLIDGCERAICTVKLPETGAEAGMAAGLCELKEYAARQGKLEGI